VSLLLLGLAFAHHGIGTTQVTAPSLPPPTAGTASDDVQVEAGLRYDLARLDEQVQEDQRTKADRPVSMHRAALSGRLFLPGQRSVGLSAPVGLVSGADGSVVGAGDVSLWLGQGVGDRVRLQVEGGITAPTGRYDADAALSAVDMQGQDDGSFLIATYDTRASLGAGSWSAQGRTVLQVALGAASVRGHGTLSQPLDTTPDGYRWGRDGVLGGVAISPALGPLTVELGAERRWHQTDRFAFVDTETGEPMEVPVGRRSATAVTAGMGVALGERVRCRVDGHRVVAQEADGIQLLTSGGMGAGCRVTAPWSRRRAESVADVGEDEPTEAAPSVLESVADAPEPSRHQP